MSIEILEKITEEYLSSAEIVLRNQKPFSGIFGIGTNISSDGCHDVFADRLKEALKDDGLDPYEVVKFLIYADKMPCCHNSVQYMLTAIQGLAVPFISRLSDEQKQEFKEYYDRNVPRRIRLPVQVQIYKELCR